VSIPKINAQVWLSYMKKKTTISRQIKKEYGAEDRYSMEPQKAHLTGEFVIVAKFGGHALRHSVSRLANVIRQGGRQTKNLVLVIFKKIHIQVSINCCIVLCTISGFSNVKAV